jgi:hypothetical protein
MIRFLIITLFSLLPMFSGSGEKTISDVEQTGSWIHVYDQNGQRMYSKCVDNTGDVVGWSATFWISHHCNWYYLWTASGTNYKTLYAPHIGVIIGVSGDTFTSRYNKVWIYTFDKNGKKLQTRYSAH